MLGYKCRLCGQFHKELPLHYGAVAPIQYFSIPETEREERCLLSSDMCVIDRQFFYVVGNLEIMVRDGPDQQFSWDVWVSLSEANFKRTFELWETSGRESEPPYFGWLSTRLPGYRDTVNLKSVVHTREVGRRPFVELEPADHPLAIEQRNGISWARVVEIAEVVRHGQQQEG